MKILRKITNGVLLLLIALMHIQFAFSPDVFRSQFLHFSKGFFFKVHPGMQALPFVPNMPNTDAFAAFWFFYFGVCLIPLALLVHSIERQGKALPLSFTVSYLVVNLLGSYMLPASGISMIMLPHAVYMLVSSIVRARRPIAATL